MNSSSKQQDNIFWKDYQMMTHIDFILDKDKKISIIVPDILSKINYYYEPTENLHQFDEATVYFKTKSNQLEIQKEILDDILFALHGTLKKALSNTLSLPNTVKSGKVGYSLNYMLKDSTDIPLEQFWVWSSLNHIATLIYNDNDKIYLEIVPIYPWIFSELEPGATYITFDEFIKNYKPYAIEIVPHAIALQWFEISEKYLRLIGCNNQ